jgi:LacI family transcriptional regulator
MGGNVSIQPLARPQEGCLGTTIKDVAREAGVAVGTVSRAFNDSGPIREETRRRILTAAETLRYVPNSAARSLITRRTMTIGVLLPDLYGEFFSEVIRGIDAQAQRHHYHLLVSSSHNDGTEIRAALRAMRGRVDGLIVMSPHIDARTLEANLPPQIPVVLLNCRVEDEAYDSINVDNFGGAYEMTCHLLSAGHRQIAFVRGPDGNYDGEERLRGYRSALSEHGVAPSLEWEVMGDFTKAGGERATRELLERSPRPTAVFAANDSTAIGVLSAVRGAGWSVPDDIAVAGFDDIPVARYLTPPLTSVGVSIIGVGRLATHKLLRAIFERNEHEKNSEILPAKLVVRASSAGRLQDSSAPASETPNLVNLYSSQEGPGR